MTRLQQSAGQPEISGNGQFIAASSSNTQNFGDDILVMDHGGNVLTTITGDPNAPENPIYTFASAASVEDPGISGDGRFVSFLSTSTEVVAGGTTFHTGDTNGIAQVYVYDRQDNTLQMISVNNHGQQGNGDSGAITLGSDNTDDWVSSFSADGRFVVFQSAATNLAPGGGTPAGDSNIYLYDLQTHTIALVSAAADGTPALGDSMRPEISPDGQYVTFASDASNLPGANGEPQTYIVAINPVTGTPAGGPELASTGFGGAENGQNELGNAVSNDGAVTAFGGAALAFNAGQDQLVGNGQAQLLSAGAGTVHFSNLSITDYNAADTTLTVTLSVAHGTLAAFAPTSGLTIVDHNDGSLGTLEFSGSLDAINAALQSGVVYTPTDYNTDAPWSDALTGTVEDSHGNTATVTGQFDPQVQGIFTGGTSSGQYDIFLANESTTPQGAVDVTNDTTLSNTTLNGGTVTVESGVTLTLDNVVLNNVHLVADGGEAPSIHIDANDTLTWAGTSAFTGPGSVVIDNDGHVIHTGIEDIGFSQVTWGGSGTVTQNGGNHGIVADETVINDGNTFDGYGQMGNNAGGVTIHNEAGTFDGDTAGNALVLDTGNTIVNDGTFEATDGGTLRIVNSTLDNDGSIVANGGTVFLGGPVTGDVGTATIENGGTLELGSSDAQAVVFNDASTLRLDHQDQGDAQAYTGAISGFGPNDVVDLSNVAYASDEQAVWTQATTADGGSGTLQILSGNGTVEASLNLNGIYAPGEFALASDGSTVDAGHPGTDVNFNYISFATGSAQGYQYDGFSDDGFFYGGTGYPGPQISSDGSALTLTDGGVGEAASWFANNRVSVGGFTASFDYQATPGGDGMAFVLQDDPNGKSALETDFAANGGTGLGMAGISPSVAVQFNIYSGHTPGTNFVTDDSTGNYNLTSPVDFWDTGDKIQVALSYDGSTLTETLTDLANGNAFSTSYDQVDLAQILGSDTAFVGVTAASGGATSAQTVSDFIYTAEAPPPPPPPPPVDTWNNNDSSGQWSDTANWSDGNSSPGVGVQATITTDTNPQIISNVTLDNVTLDNGGTEGATISVASGAILTLLDNTVISNGTLSIDSQSEVDVANGENGGATFTGGVAIDNAGALKIEDGATLALGSSVTLTGGGEVSMAGDSQIAEVNTGTFVTLDNVDNDIFGAGTIGAGDGNVTLINEHSGTIDADVSGATLSLDTGTTETNAGLMEATNGGTLSINDALNNSGTVLADGGTVVFSFGASIGLSGTGSVTIAGGGVVDLAGDAFQNITFAGPGTLEAASNHGTITGFGTGDVYDLLDDDPYTPGQTAVWTQTATGSGAGGTLQIYSSSHSLEATLDLAGTYTTADFALAPDSPAEGASTDVVFNSPDYWGSFTTKLTPGVHLQGGDLQYDGLAEVAAVLYSSVSEYNPIGDPAGPYSVTRELLPLDPFLLPILDGAQVVVPATDLTLPAKAKVILPNISAGESVSPEGIGVGVTQVDGNNVIDQIVVTANGDAPLTVGSPTPLESGSDTANTIYNLDLSFRNDNSTPTTDIPYLSTYAVAWDQYNSGTYTIDFQIFNADGSASSGVVTPEAFTKFNGESISATPSTNEATNLPAWEFRNGGGIYALAIAASSGDEDVVQFLGYNLNGTRNTTDSADLKSFTILPHLAAYSGNDPTNEITQDVIPSLSPFPGAPSQQLEFAQVSANNANDWLVGWNETVTNAGTGAFLGDQVEFAVVKPGVTNPILQYTDQLSDAQNIRVATYTDASGHDFVVFAYGDATATHLVEFEISNSGGTATEIASVTDPTTQPFTDVTSLGNGLFAVEYDNVVGPGETSQFDYKIFDFATTGLNNPTLSTTEANYIVGTHFDDVVTGANGVNNLYYFVGDAAGGAAPHDTFHGGSGGWNIAIFADARSDYTISTQIENGPNITTITSDGADPAHTGSLAVTNVEFLAFDPAGDPTPQNGTIDVNGGTFVILGGSNAVTIEAGATAEIDAAASGQTSYTGNVTFAGATGTVQVDQLNGLTGPISGISGNGNVLDLDGFNAQQGDVFAVTPDHTGSVTLLTVTDTTNNTSETVTLNGDYAPDNNVAWSSSYDGHGGVDVVDPPLTSANAGSLGFLPNDEQITFESNGETIYTIDSALTAATGTNQGAQIANANVVVGGPGNDTFVFQPGLGAQTIANFNPQQDKLELDHFADAQTVQELQSLITTDAHGDALINLGHGDSVTLANTTTTQLQQAIQANHVLLH